MIKKPPAPGFPLVVLLAQQSEVWQYDAHGWKYLVGVGVVVLLVVAGVVTMMRRKRM
jgi:hypothetical protein